MITVEDGNNLDAIGKAIEQAKAEKEKPSFIKITTKIGYGVPAKEGRASAHGEPLGEENIKVLRKNLNWPLEEAFAVPQEVYAHYRTVAEKGAVKESEWNKMFAA